MGMPSWLSGHSHSSLQSIFTKLLFTWKDLRTKLAQLNQAHKKRVFRRSYTAGSVFTFRTAMAQQSQVQETYEIAAEWLIEKLEGTLFAWHAPLKLAWHSTRSQPQFTLTLFSRGVDHAKGTPSLKIPVGPKRRELMRLVHERGEVAISWNQRIVIFWIVELPGQLEDGAPTPSDSSSSPDSSGSPHGPASGSQPGSDRGSRQATPIHHGPGHHLSPIMQTHSDPSSAHGSRRGSQSHSQNPFQPGREHGSRCEPTSHAQYSAQPGSGERSPSQAAPGLNMKRSRSSSGSGSSGNGALRNIVGGKKKRRDDEE